MRRFLHPVFLIRLIAVLLLPSAGQGQSAWKPTETIPKTDSFGGVELVANAVQALGRAERVARRREGDLERRLSRASAADKAREKMKSLDQAGIVIPYPQQDVHLESSGPHEVKVVAPAGAEALRR